MRPRLRPLGDAALLIELGDTLDEAVFHEVARTLAALDSDPPAGATEMVPAYTAVAVHYDPAMVAYEELRDVVQQRLACDVAPAAASVRTIDAPVRYGGSDGPDLEHVAAHAGLRVDDVVRLHSSAEYVVRMIGFAPGFPYLSGMPHALATPRRDSPRERVRAGSVGIAGVQTGIYPHATPGGWNLIGHTDLALFDAAADPPSLLRVGDRVRFVPVS